MHNLPLESSAHRLGLPLALAAGIAIAFSGASLAQDEEKRRGGRPFNQAVVASSSSEEILEAQLTMDSSSGEPVEILRSAVTIRPQDSNDLLINFDAECSALINAVEDGGEPEPEPEETAEVTGASVAVWVELDGEPVPVANDGSPDSNGSVVYCTADGTADFAVEEPATILAQLEASKSAGSFSWSAADLGKGDHELVVYGAVDLQVNVPEGTEIVDTEIAEAMGYIGNRVLTVELANASYADIQSTDEEDEG